jgi:DNA-binding FrmR family transcriptional regulator
MVSRVARIEGHVHAVRDMLVEDRPCGEVLIQLAAIKSAVNQVARLVFEDHLNSCVRNAATSGDVDAELERLKTALSRYFAF